MRTQKRQYDENGDMQYYVDYIWEDGKLQAQYVTLIVYINYKGVTTVREVGPFTSKIIYDESGVPQGFMMNDVMQYAFVRNLQGDVIAVVDQNGATVMEYSYDPWGNIEYHLSETFGTEEDAMLFTALCPLTYRGYNYDFTTGLYYLQSRYYNPEWGRFINCDDTNILLATQGETHNANLFAYCDNNPVNRVDYSGRESVPLNILIPVVVLACYGVFTAPMSSYIMTMDDLAINYSYSPKYELFTVASTWYTHKWYRYDYFDIITYGAPVKGWYDMYDEVNKYLTGTSIASLVASGVSVVAIVTKYLTLLSSIATIISLPVGIVALLATMTLSKLETNLRGKPDDEWYIFNWRVDYRYWSLFAKEQKQTLYAYSALATIV